MTPFGSMQGENSIFSICFVNPELGWLTADFGRIAKYSNATSVEDDLNDKIDFSLEQNYPNPFNPSTRINYNVGEPGLVQLKVYNILGVEIATLVNEQQNSGNYTVEFDAERFSSGVYLYTLTAGRFIDSRKMILLR